MVIGLLWYFVNNRLEAVILNIENLMLKLEVKVFEIYIIMVKAECANWIDEKRETINFLKDLMK